MKNIHILSIQSSISGYRRAFTPSHFGMKTSENFKKLLSTMRSVIEEHSLNEIVTQNFTMENYWGVIDELDNYSSTKTAFRELKEAPFSVHEPKLVVKQDGFYFKSDFKDNDFPGFQTETIKFSDI